MPPASMEEKKADESLGQFCSTPQVANLNEHLSNWSGSQGYCIETVAERWQSWITPLMIQVDIACRKMEESVTGLDHRIPPVVKQVSNQALSATQKAPEVARNVVSEIQRDGVVGTAKNKYVKYEPLAKELYSTYEPVAEKYAVSTWQALNRLPLFPRVAEAVVPTAAYCSEKYNQTVLSTAENGYRVANYLPLVPTEKIAKVFSANHEEMETEIQVS